MSKVSGGLSVSGEVSGVEGWRRHPLAPVWGWLPRLDGHFSTGCAGIESEETFSNVAIKNTVSTNQAACIARHIID